jgi:hypothetical protein
MKVLNEPQPIPTEHCRLELRQLVMSMLLVDPAQRPSALDILGAEWVCEYDRKRLHETVRGTLIKLLPSVRPSLPP